MRFIPARAGNTDGQDGTETVEPVHPRACGEHGSHPGAESPAGGSSPRVRGTLESLVAQGYIGRFIPARAGNTIPSISNASMIAVHPRACGEHDSGTGNYTRCRGSSPRVRGTPFCRYPVVPSPRFIPARAGNTCRDGMERSLQTVHPRACGEHQIDPTAAAAGAGSSPRVRGTLPLPGHGSDRRRFIPARAGNTPSGVLSSDASTVHPRACGEHRSTPSPASSCAGSSPRVRGTQQAKQYATDAERFIPARAGNTRGSP